MSAAAVPALKRKDAPSLRQSEHPAVFREPSLLLEKDFTRLLCLERKRSERSGKPILLVLINGGGLFGVDGVGSVREAVTARLFSCTRDTDILGWYEENSVLAVLCTEICDPPFSAVPVLFRRIKSEICQAVTAKQIDQFDISVHLFPDNGNQSSGGPADLLFYPEVKRRKQNVEVAVKRIIDVLGSLVGIVLLSPIFLLTALIIKLTSKGPVLFRQTRVGQNGRKFLFLKFRSMYVNSDPGIHKDYVTRLILGAKGTLQTDGNGNGAYKITADARVTPVGRFLRRTSIDELPQLLNVLKGEMSLVGPRPPLPYEVERYHLWHRRRYLTVKPGITGLWQVTGRSRTTFDEMVRLDLKYIKEASIILDFKILLQTPRAVFSGDGAY